MPDTRYWIGSDGDWNTAGNWDPSGVPVDADSAILNGDNDVAITTGLSHAAVDLALLFIGDDFTKDVGSVASRLLISSDLIVHRGKGSFYQGAATLRNAEVIISHTGSQQNVSWDYNGFMPIQLAVSRGRVIVEGTSAAITDLILSFVSSRTSDSHVTIAGSAGIVGRLLMDGGTVVIEGSPSSTFKAFVNGGRLTIGNMAQVAGAAIHIASNGVVEWNTVDNGNSDLLEANVYDGLLDFTQTREEKTATLVNLWPDGEFRFFPDLTTRTVKEWDGKTVDIG